MVNLSLLCLMFIQSLIWHFCTSLAPAWDFKFAVALFDFPGLSLCLMTADWTVSVSDCWRLSVQQSWVFALRAVRYYRTTERGEKKKVIALPDPWFGGTTVRQGFLINVRSSADGLMSSGARAGFPPPQLIWLIFPYRLVSWGRARKYKYGSVSMKMLILSFLMDVFQERNIPPETFQSPADFITASNISVLFPLREEKRRWQRFYGFSLWKVIAEESTGEFCFTAVSSQTYLRDAILRRLNIWAYDTHTFIRIYVCLL